MWAALFIPLIGIAISFVFFRDKTTWWEYLLPLLFSILVIFIGEKVAKYNAAQSTEYWNGLGLSARYTEYYETYVHQTCSRQVACGETCSTDSKGQQTCVTQYCTEYYDCSYCDHHNPYWELTNNIGESFPISESDYLKLKRRWKSDEKFIELNRDINFESGCGKDGDAYEIYWDNQILTSEPTVTEHSYENKLITNSNFLDVSNDDIKRYGLFEYPKLNYYDQQVLLGADSFPWLSSNDKRYQQKVLSYLNGKYGSSQKVKIFVLLFTNLDQHAAFLQEALWKGGNQNEFVVCIGLNKDNRNLNWVYTFSPCNNKRLVVNLREDLMEIGDYNIIKIDSAIENNIQNFKVRNFKEDFKDIEVEPSTTAIIIVWFLVILCTTCTIIFTSQNQFNND